ncbi:lipocalin/fatty-acid binding family protein, partial [Klebsiella pneumoniae]|uniref:lipocalin/fatty-acid binding family protein n=1 Tax=Klebsiella pneumoniae TaxID=573 RepID=UPI0025A08129
AEEASSMERNFNVEKINGEWYTIMLATDKREKIEEHGSMRAFVENITVLENSLVFKFHLIVNEECTEMTAIGEQTEK